MSKPVKIKSPKTRRVIDNSPKPGRISGETIASALGAQPVASTKATNLPPDAHVDLVAQVAAEIVSTGGRPARRETTERKKIPLTRSEWGKLQEIAKECKLRGVSASPAQIGGILVRESLKAYQVSSEFDVLNAAASSSSKLEQLSPVALALLGAMKVRHTTRKKSGD